MSSSSSVSSSSSSPLPSAKSPSNQKSKNNRKDENSPKEVCSSHDALAKNKQQSKSFSLLKNNDQTKVGKNCVGPSAADKTTDVINCNGNTSSSDSFKTVAREKRSSSDTLSAIISNKNSPSSIQGSPKQPPTPKEELFYLASVLDFSVTYTNFPQKNNTDVVTLVKLTTNPPKVIVP